MEVGDAIVERPVREPYRLREEDEIPGQELGAPPVGGDEAPEGAEEAARAAHEEGEVRTQEPQGEEVGHPERPGQERTGFRVHDSLPRLPQREDPDVDALRDGVDLPQEEDLVVARELREYEDDAGDGHEAAFPGGGLGPAHEADESA